MWSLLPALLVALISVLLYFYAPRIQIQPSKGRPDFSRPLRADSTLPVKVATAKVHFKGVLKGPESFARDPVSGDLLTGTSDGWIWRIKADLSRAEKIVRLSDPDLVCEQEPSPECGRVLGIRHVAADKFIVSDAWKGIFALHLATKTLQILVNPDKNMETKSNRLFNSVEVVSSAAGSKNGSSNTNDVVYFTVSSLRWNLNQVFYSLLEYDDSGRLYRLCLRTKKISLVADGLHFPNGLTLSRDGRHLLLCELLSRRILRIDIQAKSPKIEVFLDNLPGFPDNIRRNSKGFFIGLVSTATETINRFFTYPTLSYWVAYLTPLKLINSAIAWESEVWHINEDAEVISVIRGDNQKMLYVTEAFETDSHVVLGSFVMDHLLSYNKKDIL